MFSFPNSAACLVQGSTTQRPLSGIADIDKSKIVGFRATQTGSQPRSEHAHVSMVMCVRVPSLSWLKTMRRPTGLPSTSRTRARFILCWPSTRGLKRLRTCGTRRNRKSVAQVLWEEAVSAIHQHGGCRRSYSAVPNNYPCTALLWIRLWVAQTHLTFSCRIAIFFERKPRVSRQIHVVLCFRRRSTWAVHRLQTIIP